MQRAIVVRQIGEENEVSRQISEGIWEAECHRLEAENAQLRAQLREAEARVGLFGWGYNQQRAKRLQAECKLDKRKASIWGKIASLI